MALQLKGLSKNPLDKDPSKIANPQGFDCTGYSDDRGSFQLDIIVSPGDGAGPVGTPQSWSMDLPGRTALTGGDKTQTEGVSSGGVGARVRVDACLHAKGGLPAFDPRDPRWKSFGTVRVVG